MNTELFPARALHRDAFGSPRLALVPVPSDAMAPTLRGNWDYVLAAPVATFLYDSLYVVDRNGVPDIYRVQSTLAGVTLMRDNERYSTFDVSREWLEEHVLGIVVCDLKVRDAELLRQAWGGAS